MNDHGIFIEERLMIVCGSKDKALEMLENYPGGKVWPVENVKGKWIKKE